MLFRKAFQFRLEPTPQQRLKMAQTAGCVRLVWNRSLFEVKKSLDDKTGYCGYVKMAERMKEMKSDEPTSFLKLVHSQPLQQVLKDLDRAVRDGFKKTKGFPKFKKKTRDKSFRYPQGVKLSGSKIYLPKIGWVRFRKSREITGVIKNTTVRFDCGNWYASIQTEWEQESPTHPGVQSPIGLDMGIASFVRGSDGTQVRGPSAYRKHERRLAREQRRLARKKKGSNNRVKQLWRVQRVHKKIRDCRQDFLHKCANDFCKNHAVIVIEGLLVKNMSASSKGTLENPGCMVKQKSGLNKSILDQGWYQFRQMLEYKQSFLGGEVVVVPPQYTSQRCSVCGHTEADNRQSQSVFECRRCHHADHADINAAKNIRAAGTAVLACGDIAPVRALAQESPPSEASAN